ncbi:MAG: sulfotransferase [Chloroflexota bacterium]
MKAPIFVIGYMHSGTTMLKDIIERHPSIYSIRGESRFFHSLSMLKRRYPDLNDAQIRRQFVTYLAKLANSNYRSVEYGENQSLEAFNITAHEVDELVKQTATLTSHAMFFKSAFDFYTAKHGKERWLEKTPTHLFHVEKILKTNPEALFIELVRDPRDVLGSKNSRVESADKMSRNEISQKIKNWRVGYDPIWDSLAWKSAIRSGAETAVKHSGKILRVRYEDLVQSPKAEAQKIFTFLGLEFSEEMLQVSWHNTADETKWQQTGITADSIGKWQKRLNLSDVAVCQFITRAEMNQLSYQKINIPLKSTLMLPSIFLKSGYEFFERIYRRYKLGGTAQVRTVIENYIIRFRGISKSKP